MLSKPGMHAALPPEENTDAFPGAWGTHMMTLPTSFLVIMLRKDSRSQNVRMLWRGCISTTATPVEYAVECQLKQMNRAKCQMLEISALQIKATQWQFPQLEQDEAWPRKEFTIGFKQSRIWLSPHAKLQLCFPSVPGEKSTCSCFWQCN